MLSPKLKHQIFELWSRFWASGLTNPITAIEQITYLLFLKQLEVLDEERVKRGYYTIYGRRKKCPLKPHSSLDISGVTPPPPPGILTLPKKHDYCVGHNSARWSVIKQTPTSFDPAENRTLTPHDHLSRYVFPWLRELDKILDETASYKNGNADDSAKGKTNGFDMMRNAPMENAAFQLPPDKIELLQFAIGTIDQLFEQVGRHSANYDLMGDIFEYMLGEIQTSGKNGQFRTPRHIIRFMIELLDPKPGDRIVDPAGGTCGFLINSLLHMRKQSTPKEELRLEWDGTPHRAHGSDPNEEQYLKNGDYFVGYENDQTMARIGWMNMILHGIENPHMVWRDSLSKKLGDEESNKYDYAFANPPYTGNVDISDLSDVSGRFPRADKGNKPITDKSELLFVWLLLDLVALGGRVAVIVPEGVLFGSTTAHRALRRQLLLENRVEAVISLPAGVFQPYTGVKTSILVFQKDVNRKREPGKEPITREVWFYEVTADGRSLDAKRSERPEENDLWDAQVKFRTRTAETRDYFKPDIYTERWRDVDDRTLQIFPELAREKRQTRGIHELFNDLKEVENPEQAEKRVIASQSQRIIAVYARFIDAAKEAAIEAAARKKESEQRQKAAEQSLSDYRNLLNRLFREAGQEMLEALPAKSGAKNYADEALKLARKELQNDFDLRSEWWASEIAEKDYADFSLESDSKSAKAKLENLSEALKPEVKAIVREFAKLDGYEIRLRSLDLNQLKDHLKESLSWSAPVRVWQRNDQWQNEDGSLQGSHDEYGNLRPEYLLDENLYNKDGTAKSEYLELFCIEANDLNLTAGRYKPFTVAMETIESPAKIIQELQELETRIQQRLERLLDMVGGAK
jgi:type I restriction enzyme M protein